MVVESWINRTASSVYYSLWVGSRQGTKTSLNWPMAQLHTVP